MSGPSVFDSTSDRFAEDLGFELGMFAGSTAALAVQWAPDLVLLSPMEFAEQAYRIYRAAELPLLVDADHGFGNALSVKRTVQEALVRLRAYKAAGEAEPSQEALEDFDLLCRAVEEWLGDRVGALRRSLIWAR